MWKFSSERGSVSPAGDWTPWSWGAERVMDGGGEAAGARTHQIMRDVVPHQRVGLYLKALRTH